MQLHTTLLDWKQIVWNIEKVIYFTFSYTPHFLCHGWLSFAAHTLWVKGEKEEHPKKTNISTIGKDREYIWIHIQNNDAALLNFSPTPPVKGWTEPQSAGVSGCLTASRQSWSLNRRLTCHSLISAALWIPDQTLQLQGQSQVLGPENYSVACCIYSARSKPVLVYLVVFISCVNLTVWKLSAPCLQTWFF